MSKREIMTFLTNDNRLRLLVVSPKVKIGDEYVIDYEDVNETFDIEETQRLIDKLERGASQIWGEDWRKAHSPKTM